MRTTATPARGRVKCKEKAMRKITKSDCHVILKNDRYIAFIGHKTVICYNDASLKETGSFATRNASNGFFYSSDILCVKMSFGVYCFLI